MSNERPPFPPEDAFPPLEAPGRELLPPPYILLPAGWQGPPKFQHRLLKHVVLFVLTLCTTTMVGACHYASFATELGRLPVTLNWGLLWQGLWYSLPLLAILGAHESGHYLFCRRYNVDATLPYFIPLLLPAEFQIGTLGAVIRIRDRFPTKAVLFDIGIAGPVFGFVVLVPVLAVGLLLSSVVPSPPESSHMLFLGEPLLFQWAAALVIGQVPEGYSLNAHPMVFAAWFGMLATALNLLPFGQLDGGHITYATLGPWARPLSKLTLTAAVVMTFFSTSWIAMTILLVLMTVITGFGHPPVVYEHVPLGRSRYIWALIAVVMLILCFTPVPISLVAPP